MEKEKEKARYTGSLKKLIKSPLSAKSIDRPPYDSPSEAYLFGAPYVNL